VSNDRYAFPAGERFIPFTPAGSIILDCAAPTEDKAWAKLLKAAAHMPYPDKAAFVRRGYTVEDSWKWVEKK